MTAVIPRVLILAVMLAAGLPAVAQDPAPNPPPSSTNSSTTEQQPADAPAPSEENAKTDQATDPNAPSDAKKEEQKKKKGALGRLKDHVKDHFSTGCVGAGTAGGCWGDGKDKKGEQQAPAEKNPAPPRSSGEGDPEFSSSRDTQIDLNPPGQERPVRKPKPDDDVQELRHYDPHAAEKDIEVGEYYLKTGNLEAALARFRSALDNKPNDALATFRLAQALEKAKQLAEARENYQKYLQILPKGEFAAECQKALERLPAPPAETAEAAPTSAPAGAVSPKR